MSVPLGEFRSDAAEWDASVTPRVTRENHRDARSVRELATITIRESRGEPSDLTISYSGLHHVNHVSFDRVTDSGSDMLTVVIEIPHAPESTSGGAA